MKKFLYIILFFCVFSLYGVIDVTVGIAPEKFIVEQIGGEKVRISCIMPTGKNMHNFPVSAEMAKRVSASKVFFHTGQLFEEQLAKLVDRKKVRVFDLSRYIAKLSEPHSVQSHHSHHAHDMHTWFSYRTLYRMAVETAKVLSQIDGENAAFYFKNRDVFCQKIENARHEAEKKLRKYNNRVFLTHHAAFGYFANEFNLRQLSFEYNGREMTPKSVALITKKAKKYNIKRIFMQSNVSTAVRNAVQEALKAEIVIINPDSYDVLGTLNHFTNELEASFE